MLQAISTSATPLRSSATATTSSARVRDRPRARIRLAVQDRAQRVPLSPALLLAPWQGRGTEQLRGAPGSDSGARAGLRRVDRPAGRPRADAGEPEARDSFAGVAGAHLPRDLDRAWAFPGCRRDADLPRTSCARSGPGAGRRHVEETAARGADVGGAIAFVKALLGGGGAAAVKIAATAVAVAATTVAAATEVPRPAHHAPASKPAATRQLTPQSNRTIAAAPS